MAEGGIDSGLIYRCAVDLPARQDERLWRTNIIYLSYSIWERNSQYFQYSQVDVRLFTTKYTLVTRQKGFGVPVLFRQHWLFEGGLAIATFVINVFLFLGDVLG